MGIVGGLLLVGIMRLIKHRRFKDDLESAPPSTSTSTTTSTSSSISTSDSAHQYSTLHMLLYRSPPYKKKIFNLNDLDFDEKRGYFWFCM